MIAVVAIYMLADCRVACGERMNLEDNWVSRVDAWLFLVILAI